jgi:hypothetical protein
MYILRHENYTNKFQSYLEQVPLHASNVTVDVDEGVARAEDDADQAGRDSDRDEL